MPKQLILRTILFLSIILSSCIKRDASAPSNNMLKDNNKTQNNSKKNLNKTNKEVKAMNITVSWKNGHDIPMEFVHSNKGGDNVSPEIKWDNIKDAKQYLVVMVDHHPVARHWIHWIFTVPSNITHVPKKASNAHINGMHQYNNTWGNPKYEGPAAPKGTGKHDYHIVVFALNKKITLPNKISWDDILKITNNITLAKGDVIGYYETK